jgi:DNA-directed RNA polymerase sigma subunit (sigma70/sigma32)
LIPRGLPTLPFPSVSKVKPSELEILSGRSQHVLRKRRGGAKLSDLAKELRCHIDRVRQLERSALIEVREHREREAESGASLRHD